MPTEPYPAVDPGVARASLLPVREMYRRLRFAGLTARQAGTLVAHLAGLAHAPAGWTVAEVEGLLFVRALVAAGRLRS